MTIPSSAAYFAGSERYLRGNHRIELRREIVRELIGEPVGKRILDLGCGNGAVSLPFAGPNMVELVDNSEAMLESARSHAASLGVGDYLLLQSDAAGLHGRAADIVLAIGLLAHVDNPESVIEAIARNLVRGGKAIVQFSDSSRILNRVGRLLFALRGTRYQPTSRSQIVGIGEAHGLRLIDERSHLLVLPGVPRLMGSALLGYDRFVRKHPTLARHGLDTIFLFAKD